MSWSIVQMARNAGTSDAASYSAAQKHYHTARLAASSTFITGRIVFTQGRFLGFSP